MGGNGEGVLAPNLLFGQRVPPRLAAHLTFACPSGSVIRVRQVLRASVRVEDQQLPYRNQRMLENLVTLSAVKEAWQDIPGSDREVALLNP
jgi:hypothetical protein